MKRFVLKILAASSFAVCVVAVWTGFAMRNCTEIGNSVAVAEAIRLSGRSFPNATIVILGDSVGKQLLGPAVISKKKRTDITSLASNQAILPLGNRLLLENYLKLNPQTERVVYVVRPTSLANDGHRLLTFHHFIYPFCNTGLIGGISEAYQKELESRFGRIVFQSLFVRKFLYSNNFFYNIYEKEFVSAPEGPLEPIPDFCLEELATIRNICANREIEFSLLPPPMKDGTQLENSRFVGYLSQNGFQNLAEAYASEFRYRPASDFHDGIHLLAAPQAEETDHYLTLPILNRQ